MDRRLPYIPNHVIAEMADAMIEPNLRIESKVPDGIGRDVRIQVLERALIAAMDLGWRLREDPKDGQN